MKLDLDPLDYSAAYHTKRLTSQGWLYISENYIAFYSFLLGIETKLLVELKDIQDIKKEKSKRGVFSDAIKLVTKDKQEVRFCDFFLGPASDSIVYSYAL